MANRYPCASDPELFFSTAQNDIAYAKTICAQCPARLACLQAGRTRREFGIWGGETEQERTKLGYRPPKERAPARCGTEAGAAQHRRAGEKVCTLCLEGAARARQARVARKAELAA